MNNTLKKYLLCPSCKSSLEERNNKLICTTNRHSFEINHGIPVLLDYTNLHRHSKNQQTHFEKTTEKRTIDSVKHMKPHEIQYLKRFVDNFKKIKNSLILEVGTGSGYMSFGLAKCGAKVIACDITINNLIILKEFAKTLGLENNILFVCCSADQLPFKNNTFDYFVINAVLEHIPRELEAINEIERTLKKGGGLMITVPILYKYIFPLLLPVNFLHDKRIGHLRRYDETSLKNKFPHFFLKRVYFTGHTLKVIKFLINLLVKIFDEQVIEMEDAKRAKNKIWSSNVIAFFQKK